MSAPPQSPAYLARLRDRLVAIKQNTANITTRVTSSIERKTQSWRSDPACHPPHPHPLAVTLPGNFRFTDTSSDDGIMSPLGRQNSNTRSDSMSPVVPEENGQLSEGFRGYYSMNSMKMRKLRLEEMRRMLPGGGESSGFATVGRARGQEIQDVLRGIENGRGGGNGTSISGMVLEDRTRSEERREEENEVSSNPYPDDFLIPDSQTPSRPRTDDDVETSSNPYPDDFPIPDSQPLSRPRTDDYVEVSSNPYPDDYPIPSSPPELPLRTQTSSKLRGRTSPSPQNSTFSIFPADKPISPICPYNATRHRLSAAQSLRQSQSHASLVSLQNSIRSSEQRDEWIDRYVQDLPECDSMTREERRLYFDELSSYKDNSPKFVRREMRGSPLPMRRGMLENAQVGRMAPPLLGDVREGPERIREAAKVQGRLLGSAGQSYEGLQNEHNARCPFLDNSSPGARRLVLEAGNHSPAPNARTENEEPETRIPNNPQPITQGTGTQAYGKRKSSAGRRLLHTIICRPGACTPDCPVSITARTTNPYAPTTTAALQKFKLSSRFRDLLTRRKDRGKVVEQPADPEPDPRREYQVTERRRAVPSSWRENQDNSHAYYMPPQPPALRIGQSNAKRYREVSDVESKTGSLTGPPVHLSKMIHRAPGSIISPSPSSLPSPALGTGPSRYRQRQESTTPRKHVHSASRPQTHTPVGPSRPRESTQRSGSLTPTQQSFASTPNPHSSSSTLNDRLRRTRLEDLHGSSSSSAQEVRSLLSDVEKDRKRHTPPTTKPHATLPRRTNELPGGFTRDTMRTVTPLGGLDRRFTSQRQVNEHVAYQSRARYRSNSSLRSHGSSLTVPRGWRVAEGSGNGQVEVSRSLAQKEGRGDVQEGERKEKEGDGDLTLNESFPMRNKGKGKAILGEEEQG